MDFKNFVCPMLDFRDKGWECCGCKTNESWQASESCKTSEPGNDIE